jgi:hypothetical protein
MEGNELQRTGREAFTGPLAFSGSQAFSGPQAFTGPQAFFIGRPQHTLCAIDTFPHLPQRYPAMSSFSSERG